jgi:ABC-type multidrug transport system fused ATPase/permease subunit
MGLLKEKTRILVTHAVDFMHLADRIVVMEGGRVSSFGTFDELKNNSYLEKVLNIHYT